MTIRQPTFRWWLTLTWTKKRHLASRSLVTAPSLVDACRMAIRTIRERRLTDPNGVEWDRWTLMGRDAVGRPMRIVATGNQDHTLWTDTQRPLRKFRRGA